MYVRCPRCLEASRLLSADVDREFTCAGCGTVHALGSLDELGATPEARAARAQRYSEQHGIDLASAYSVLLGLMPIERGLETQPADPTGAPRAARYDRGFLPAVEGGFLTPRQAVERGDRVLYASRLSQVHGLSMNLAFLVADNRLMLRDALSTKKEQHARKQIAAETASARSRAYAGGFAVVVGSATLLAAIGLWTTMLVSDQRVKYGNDATAAVRPRADRPAPELTVSTEVRRDADDQPLEIRGQHPRAVLEAFCALRPGRTLQGLHPAADGYWTGSYQEEGRAASILIQTTADGASWNAIPEIPPLPERPADSPD